MNYTEDSSEFEDGQDEDWDEELAFQREVIEAQMNLTQTRLQRELEELKALAKQQKRTSDKRTSKTSDEIERLENKLERKRSEINREMTKKQMKLISKQLEKQREFLLEFDKIERDALLEQEHVTKKIQKKQRDILEEKLKKEKKEQKDTKAKSKKEKKNKKKTDKGGSTPSADTTPAEVEVTGVTESLALTSQSNVTADTDTTEFTASSGEIGAVDDDSLTSGNVTSREVDVTEVDESLGSSPQPNATEVAAVTESASASGGDNVQPPLARNTSEGLYRTPSTTAPSLVVSNSTPNEGFENVDQNQTETVSDDDNPAQSETTNLELESNQTESDYRELPTTVELDGNGGLDEVPQLSDKPEKVEGVGALENSTNLRPENDSVTVADELGKNQAE